MSSDVMQVVPIRMPSGLVEEIDRLVAVLGGNRSEFIRMASEERLVRMRPLMRTLAEAVDALPADTLAAAMEGFQS